MTAPQPIRTPFRSWTTDLPPDVVRAIQVAAAANCVSPAMVLSDSHERPVATARRQAIGALYDRGYHAKTIGRFLGDMHRTSVLYHLGKLGKLRRLKAQPYDFTMPDESGVWAI